MPATDLIPDSLSHIREHLVGHGATEAAATESIILYAQFLDLIAQYPGETLCPPWAADEAWHIHLEMDTYSDDCLRVCGRLLGHDPDAFGTPAFQAAWGRTRDLFRHHFAVDLTADPDAKGQGSLAPASCFLAQAA